jgi:hypothetical protein
MLRLLSVLTALGALFASPLAAAQNAPAAPRPDTYLCPNATAGTSIDCFLDAVPHLYTMCRQVKSIEIIEFGYEKSDEGVNGAKSEYCVDKHKISITRPYQAALREAKGSRNVLEGLRGLYEHWLKALAELKWKPGETDEQYKGRIAQPYDAFTERAGAVRVALTQATGPTSTAGTAAPAKTPAAKPKPAKTAAKSPN